MIETQGFGSSTPSQKTISPLTFSRQEPQGTELQIEILYCGLCHSDVELLANNWSTTKYPCIPGHEAVGRVTALGPDVTQYKPGDIVGIGTLMDSCLSCSACGEGFENLCEGPNGAMMLHGGFLTPGDAEAAKVNTFGAWSGSVVVKERFVIRIPEGTGELERVAPVFCAGTDTWGPLRRLQLDGRSRLGIIGLGGPGHLALQMAKKMGTGHIVVFTTHPEEKREAALCFGADEVVDSNDPAAMKGLHRSLNYILSTVPVPFDPTPYLRTLRRRGTMTVMALLGPYKNLFNNFELAVAGLNLRGSMIGSIQETRESLAFCLEHGILPEVEVIEAEAGAINNAIKRLKVADVRFRIHQGGIVEL
ncbi:hypothetical protein PRZ48_004015 [Zasmidium cellare]|uniref:Enoyl reductase (ER) domain-containing protein n=1 Tax=Zasmidium cellare TaxID=395010 RepID=A0ABR0EXX8_ZASCE|nr:hypothetical protein PRZ48_004015 [Zasmidium cellare]